MRLNQLLDVYKRQAFDKAFEKYDVILGPAAPTTAPKLGESLSCLLYTSRCV